MIATDRVKTARILRAAFLMATFFLAGCAMPERYLFSTAPELDFSSDIEELEFQEIIFPAGDGPNLYGWYLPRADSEKVVLYFHGTATNLSHLTPLLKDFRHLDVSLFIFDYRGFGRSEGEPTEAGTYQDARGALEFLERLGLKPEQMVYYGHSLGAAIALQLALEKPPAGLVLESPFTSIPELIRHHHPLAYSAMPWAFPSFYDNRSKIGELQVPLMIFHGARDPIVPPAMGRTLYALAPSPKSLHLVAEAEHANVFGAAGSTYWSTWRDFLTQVSQP